MTGLIRKSIDIYQDEKYRELNIQSRLNGNMVVHRIVVEIGWATPPAMDAEHAKAMVISGLQQMVGKMVCEVNALQLAEPEKGVGKCPIKT
jgi:hypothetical protein